MKYRKLNRLERKADNKRRLEESRRGEGLFVFENNSKGDYQLSKPLTSGKTWVKPGEQFQGDSYYNQFIGKGLKQIRVIIDPNEKRNIMNEQKLILDQPDRVTNKGTIEQVIPTTKSKQINEKTLPKKIEQEVLINEDPMDGVEILLG